MKTVDDRQLVEQAKAGSEEAFSELVRRHSAGMHRRAARILSDREEAWDVVQMAFLKAWQKLDTYEPTWSFSTWLYRIASNVAIDLLRSRGSRQRTHDGHISEVLGDNPVARSEPSGHRRLEAAEIDAVLRDLADLLPEKQRLAFLLREVEGLPSAEVAETLGCSTVTVRNHIFQARKQLRSELEKRYPELVPERRRSNAL